MILKIKKKKSHISAIILKCVVFKPTFTTVGIKPVLGPLGGAVAEKSFAKFAVPIFIPDAVLQSTHTHFQGHHRGQDYLESWSKLISSTTR